MAILAIIALVPAALWFHFSLPRNFSVVEQGILYRCGEGRTFQIENTMRKHHIKTILCLRKVRNLESEKQLAGRQDVNFIYQPIDTGKPIPEKYYLDFLKMTQDPNQTPLLVHCAMGRHRTGFFCALYRMVIDNWPLDKALKEMESFGFDLNSHTVLVTTLKKINPEDLRKKLRKTL